MDFWSQELGQDIMVAGECSGELVTSWLARKQLAQQESWAQLPSTIFKDSLLFHKLSLTPNQTASQNGIRNLGRSFQTESIKFTSRVLGSLSLSLALFLCQ